MVASGAEPRGFRVVLTAPEHAEALAALQGIVFPELDVAERFGARHYRRHLEVFPDGQFVAIPSTGAPAPVAATSTLRTDFDFDEPRHTFRQAIGGLGLEAHDPAGPWLYGADLGVHPDWRRRGIARALYEARRAAARRLRLRGEITVGLLNGYAAAADRMSARDYYCRLVAGELSDPTVSAQLRMGFRPEGLISGYVADTRCRGYGVLLVRRLDSPRSEVSRRTLLNGRVSPEPDI